MATQKDLNEFNEIWNTIMKSFESNLSPSTIELWFGQLILKDFDGNTVYFTIDSSFKYNVIQKKYMEMMGAGFESLLGFPVAIDIKPFKENSSHDAFAVRAFHILPAEIRA